MFKLEFLTHPHAYFVKVLDWQEEYAVADKNPEVIDEIEFWQMLLESGLISKEEYEKSCLLYPDMRQGQRE